MKVKIQYLFSTLLRTVQYFDSRETPIFYMCHRHPLQHLLSHSLHSVHCVLVGRLFGFLCPHRGIKMEPEKHTMAVLLWHQNGVRRCLTHASCLCRSHDREWVVICSNRAKWRISTYFVIEVKQASPLPHLG